MTNPEHVHIRVHCDTCTGVHDLEFTSSPGYTSQEAANLFLVAMGWETYKNRVDDVYRHRCVACVTLRYALEKAAREADQRNALATVRRMQDGHS